MAEKPTWLTALSKDSGNGGTAAEQGNATLKKADMEDLLKKRNDGLKNATPLGSASSPYNLSNSTGAASVENTANCYVISAPGYYRIPLVYGNAIKGGVDNPSSYKTSNTGPNILSNFKDHNGNDITDPWIAKSNALNTGIDGAKIVWADEKDLVHLPTSPIAHDTNGNAYLEFEVKQSDIKSGNAVVAVTKNGTVVWSWHLWFAPQSALNTIAVTNFQNKIYNFTEETVGWKPLSWSGTSYDKARTVKVKVEQTVANNGIKQVSVLNITQNPGSKMSSSYTLYQFGRKDAFPGIDETKLPQGSIGLDYNEISIQNGIQNPQSFYIYSNGWFTTYRYYNLWSINSTTTGFNDDIVTKTIYDPCPVGFKLPASNAFTGFTEDGQPTGKLNVKESMNNGIFQETGGYSFWTNSSKNTTIFFPADGYRQFITGTLLDGYGTFWSAVRGNGTVTTYLSFTWSQMNPINGNYIPAFGFAVRPVSE